MGGWSVVDPKIAAWMLDPDHPPVTFQQTLDRWMSADRKSAHPVRALFARKLTSVTLITVFHELLRRLFSHHSVCSVITARDLTSVKRDG